MKKYILTLAIALSCTTAFSYDDGTPMFRKEYFPPIQSAPIRLNEPVPAAVTEATSQRDHYQPWMYLPIQTGGGGSTFVPGAQPSSFGGQNTYVLW